MKTETERPRPAKPSYTPDFDVSDPPPQEPEQKDTSHIVLPSRQEPEQKQGLIFDCTEKRLGITLARDRPQTDAKAYTEQS